MVTLGLIVLTVLFHELGHVVSAVSLSLRVKRFGVNLHGVYIVRETGAPVRNVIVILGGPAMNLLLAAVFGHSHFGTMNLIMAIMNLLPIPNSDGRHLLDLLAKQPA